MPRIRRVLRVLLVVACGLLALPAVAGAVGPRGSLTQLGGLLGCYGWSGASEDGAGTCTQTTNVSSVSDLAVSPDGLNVYVAQYNGFPGIDVFRRDPATGALSQLPGTQGCITRDGRGHGPVDDVCADGRDLFAGEGTALAISPDGKFVYGAGSDVSDSNTSGITVFSRDAATGALTQLSGTAGCYTTDGSSEDGAGTCTTTPTVDSGVASLTMAPDGRFLYSAYNGATSRRLLAFSRNAATGAIAPLAGSAGCLVDGGAAGCTTARQVGYSQGLSITPDGRHAYAAQYNTNGVAILQRDPDSGVLTQSLTPASCISDTGSSLAGPNTCQDVRGIDGAFGTQLSRDGRTLWIMGYDASGIATFRVDEATGALTQLAGTQGCISADGSSGDALDPCADGHGLGAPYGLALSPDGRALYSAQSLAGLTVLSVDPVTGALAQPPGTDGCLTSDGHGYSPAPGENAAGICTDGRGLANTYAVAVSPDGRSAYGAQDDTNGIISAFSVQAAPLCAATTASTPAVTGVAVNLPCTDPNGDPITRQIVSGPAHGTLSAITGAAVTYAPAAGFTGTDTFAFTADDGAGAGAPATATVTVTPDTTAPTLTLLGGAKALKLTTSGVRIRVRLGEAAKLTARLTLPASLARRAHLARTLTIAFVTTHTTPAGDITITLKPTTKARKALRHLSRKTLRTLAPALTVTATDAAGNSRRLLKQGLHLTR